MSDAGGYAIVGRVRKPHGIHGELVVDNLCDEADAIFAPGRTLFVDDELGGAHAPVEVQRMRPFKNALLLVLSGVADRNTAETWRGRALSVPFEELSPLADDEVRVYEMAGMRVVHVNGDDIGEVTTVDQLPQGLLLNVQTPRGLAYVPFVPPILVGVDRDARTITIDPPAGLFEI